MNKEDVIDYVAQTPYNSNKKVLDDMLDTLMEENVQQADWNQSDDTAKDYIKNRPFYEEVKYITYIEEQTVEFTEREYGSSVSGYISNVQIPYSINQYRIIFDGVEYIATMPNEDPSLLFNLNDGIEMNIHLDGHISIYSKEYAGQHTIKVEEKIATVHIIENKYLGIPVYIGEDKNSICLNYKNNVASGHYSHAEGRSTTASGHCSHAEGGDTTASSNYSHAEGDHTTASGNGSHAEGYNTKASGHYSHAEGQSTTASGKYSHAEGWSTTASGEYQHVQGKYNIKDTTNTYSHIVGNGTSTNNLSNSHTLDWSGNAWYKGDVYIGSTSGTNKDAGSKKLATEEYVDTKITNGLSLGVHTDGKVYIFMNGTPIGNGIEINSVVGQ